MLFVPLAPYVAEPILFSDLINHPFLISPFLGTGIGLLNLFLIMLISKKVVSFGVWYVPVLLYSISPWSIYLEVGGSLYILILTCMMLIFFALRFIKNIKLSLTLLIFGSILAVYTSLLMWFVMPLLIFSIYKISLVTIKELKIYLSLFAIACLPLLLVTFLNLDVFKDISTKQVSIFSEVGLINTVNVYRGETAQTKFSIFNKLVENRYFYLSEHFVFNLLKHLTPVTYFTPEFKMFDFSFSPPILVGFLLPFIFGLKEVLKLSTNNKWIFLTFFSLILPSILSKNSPDLNRLVLLAPVMFILITKGFEDLILKRSFFYKLILGLTVALVLIQLLTVISDIFLRENMRLFQIKK